MLDHPTLQDWIGHGGVLSNEIGRPMQKLKSHCRQLVAPGCRLTEAKIGGTHRVWDILCICGLHVTVCVCLCQSARVLVLCAYTVLCFVCCRQKQGWYGGYAPLRARFGEQPDGSFGDDWK